VFLPQLTRALNCNQMPAHCLLYYITDRTAFAADEPSRRRRLLEKISEAAHAGVDYIQLREKDLCTHDLESLAREAASAIREAQKLATDHWPLATALLINSRTDVALTVEADGVHLRSSDVSPQEVRAIWKKCGAGATTRANSPQAPVVAVSCHSPLEVTQAAPTATFAVFAPVFEKKRASPAGLDALRQACATSIPVLALGGVTLENAESCLTAGAAGVAAIRLFQEHTITEVVQGLRLRAEE
jgi:thiamine-phosphate pyrophosphorylase